MASRKRKGTSRLYARCLAVKRFNLNDLPEITAFLDTGYSKAETIRIIAKMYLNKNNKGQAPRSQVEAEIYKWPWGLMLLKWEPLEDDGKNDRECQHTIAFSNNWNNKLDCLAFTTIRLYNPGKYVKGRVYKIKWDGNAHIGVQQTLL